VIDIFRGKTLAQVNLDDVAALLDDTAAEPLHWEAKGIKINPGEVRKQICGFANSQVGGFLILGTTADKGAWHLDGVTFPNGDPPAWISEVAQGVQPYPDGLDTQPLPIEDDKWITVTWVPPTPTPPCNAHGTVYERVSGATRSVREPLRLSELIKRGETAHETARWQARHAAERASAFGIRLLQTPAENVSFALGLRAVAYDDELEAHLFSEPMIELLLDTVPGSRGHQLGKDVLIDHRQDAVIAYPYSPTGDLGAGEWVVHVAWDGSVGVACRVAGIDRVGRVESLVNEHVRKAWEISAKAMALLGPRGPAYLRVILGGKQFDQAKSDEPSLTSNISGWQPGVIDRGPIEIAVSDEILSGVERETRRLLGFERVYEPSASED
jgi:hypothetical protein